MKISRRLNHMNKSQLGSINAKTKKLSTQHSGVAALRSTQKDPRNRLNDLTGREWVHFLSSVEATAYPTTGPQSYGHKLRRMHPAPKPPQLMRRVVEFFTRRGEWVLDPFMGVGGSLLGCSLAGRNAVGLDLSADYIETYREVSQQEELAPQTTFVADARQMLD